ncbi:MAG TPA: hypothetical protein VMV57_07435 [Terracidiphilus sp.]|nr:hypothetical protein [Terracidiphilus sp.]
MRQETYRFALEEANAELRDILGEFNQLRARKDQIEKVVAALKPFLTILGETENQTEPVAAEATSDLVPEHVFSMAENSFTMTFDHEAGAGPVADAMTEAAEPVQAEMGETVQMSMEADEEIEAEPLVTEMASDPFQRRIDDVLRHGVGGRELRIHSRSLNGLLSRV